MPVFLEYETGGPENQLRRGPPSGTGARPVPALPESCRAGTTSSYPRRLEDANGGMSREVV